MEEEIKNFQNKSGISEDKSREFYKKNEFDSDYGEPYGEFTRLEINRAIITVKLFENILMTGELLEIIAGIQYMFIKHIYWLKNNPEAITVDPVQLKEIIRLLNWVNSEIKSLNEISKTNSLIEAELRMLLAISGNNI